VSVLTVTLVYCVQTVGWTRMPLGMDVDLGPGDIVLDEDSVAYPHTERGLAAPTFRAMLMAKRSPFSTTAELWLHNRHEPKSGGYCTPFFLGGGY